jgi:hypothetical protein
MPTNNFPGVGFTTFGRDWNFFQKKDISLTAFGADSIDGYQPDMLITFSTQGIIFTNETAPGAGKIVEYSFNGTTVHGELDAAATSLTKQLIFNNRTVAKIWFRVKSGSTGPITISVQAWSVG